MKGDGVRWWFGIYENYAIFMSEMNAGATGRVVFYQKLVFIDFYHKN